MLLKKSLQENTEMLDGLLPVNKSNDLLFRNFWLGGRYARLYYIDGFLNDIVMERMVSNLMQITPKTIENTKDMQDFVEKFITYTEVDIYTKTDDVVLQVLSGKSAFLVDGLEGALVVDLREYPARGVDEPEKERVMRGSRDGFVETLVWNTALIRRRIRDPKLVVEFVHVGSRSQTDVAIVYIEDLVKEDDLSIIKSKIQGVKVQSLTMNMESLTECLVKKRWYNPFPKVRYTERPDSASAAILEGGVVVLVDNSPQAMLIPTSIFSFLEEPNDYYYPPVIGSYIRFVRTMMFLLTLVLSPLWYLAVEYIDKLPPNLSFLNISTETSVPIIIQLLLLEGAIDVLRLASVNTPNMLGNSLSIIGALLLGDFAVKSGWLVPDTILYMSFIAIASFTQPSIELGYAIKFLRIILLLLTFFFKVWGFALGLVLVVVLVASNKSITGKGYLYPLVPFNWKAMKALLYRHKLETEK